MSMTTCRSVLLAVALLLVLVSGPQSQQRPDVARLAGQALRPGTAVDIDPPFRCGTGRDVAIQSLVLTAEALADGEPLFFEQVPRLLRADYTGEIRLANFQVVGDFETVTFELLDPTQRTEDGGAVFTEETWQRTGTKSIAGSVISIFNPSWPNSVWQTYLRRRRLTIPKPYEFWGRFIVPGTGPVEPTSHEEVVRRNVYLNTRSTGIPASTVTQINDTVQYASHVVNISIFDFGDSQVAGGSQALNLEQVTQTFYEHFTDDYDSIAVVSHSNQVTDFGGFHRNVKNEIEGLGRPQFDNSAVYGSAGQLKSVEFYPYNGFASNETSNHEVNHQVADYWTWTPTDGVAIERKGHDPDGHTPMVTGGPVMAGAVLEANRVVADAASGQAAHGPTYQVARSATPQTYHPTSLYRWGLIPDTDVPPMQIFENQGQFDEESSASPEPGTMIAGGHKEIHINNIRGEEGARSGPVYPHWWRALIVVSRGGLIPPAEMDYWNFYGARHAATEGVSSYDGNPSFFEATQGRMPMKTDINPTTLPKITETPAVSFANLGTADWRDVRFDQPIPGRIKVGQPITISGTVTATDRSDFHQILLSFTPYTKDDIDIYTPITGGRFSTTVTFTDAQKGASYLSVYLFWPGAPSQFGRSHMGIIYVD